MRYRQITPEEAFFLAAIGAPVFHAYMGAGKNINPASMNPISDGLRGARVDTFRMVVEDNLHGFFVEDNT